MKNDDILNLAASHGLQLKDGLRFNETGIKIWDRQKIFAEFVRNGSGLVYGGLEKQKRADVLIVPHNRLDDLFLIA